MKLILLTLAILVIGTNGSISIVLGELIHSGLAIIDFVSDVLLLIAIRETYSSYQNAQKTIQHTIDSNEYIFENCHPSSFRSEWQSNINSDCDCRNVDVFCDKITDSIYIDEIHMNNNNYLEPITTDFRNDTDDFDFLEIARSSISCKPNLWALEHAYRHSFTFSNWTCTRCGCIGNLYDHNTSIALIKTDIEYESLYEAKIKYCDPHKLLTDDYNDNLDTIIAVCWAFVIIGGIIQCCAICGRSIITYLFIENGEKESGEEAAIFHMVRFGIGFLVSLLEDVPQTIVAMYYLQFLYVDDGYFCYESFSEYPDLYKMSIDPQESISVILLENPSISFAVASSIIMIGFNGVKSGFKIQSNIRKEIKNDGEDMIWQVLWVCIIAVVTILYVLSLLMPIAAVAYYDIAPNFHKTWMPAFLVFVLGCVSWGLLCCAGCVLTALAIFD